MTMWLTKRGSVVVKPDVKPLPGLNRERGRVVVYPAGQAASKESKAPVRVLVIRPYFPCLGIAGHHATQLAPRAVVDSGAVGVLLAEGGGGGVKH